MKSLSLSLCLSISLPPCMYETMRTLHVMCFFPGNGGLAGELATSV